MANSVNGKANFIEECTFSWTLHSFCLIKKEFKNGERGSSSEFPATASHCKWYIDIYPNGIKNRLGYLSVFLRLSHRPSVRNYIFTKFDMLLKNSNDKIVKELKTEHKFTDDEPDFGWQTFCEHKLLELEIKDGILKMELKLTANLGTSAELFELEEKKKYSEIKLIPDFGTLLDNRKFSDFLIKVDGDKIPVHKCIMAMRSPVFSAMLENDFSELKDGIIEITDINKDTMKHFINFIYNGKICRSLSISETQELWQAADKYDIEDLMTLCEEYLAKKIEISNVVNILLWANTQGSKNLQNKAIEFLCKNVGKFSDHSVFYKLSEQGSDLLPIIMIKMNEIFSSKNYLLEKFTVM